MGTLAVIFVGSLCFLGGMIKYWRDTVESIMVSSETLLLFYLCFLSNRF